MIAPARRLSYKLLSRIEAGRVFSDDALHSEEMDLLEIRDRHLTTEIVYGTLRWQGVLDFALARASSRNWQEVEPGARILLRMSLYQMWRMDRIPDHALVNDAVELAKRRLGKGIDRYVNGILRNLARTKPWKSGAWLAAAPPWVRVSLPQWLWERWAGRFGPDAAAEFAQSLTETPRAAFRAESAQSPAGSVPSDIVPNAWVLPESSAEQPPYRQCQDEASQLIPHLFGDVTGLRIWDACAAPGGKSAILARLAGPSGRLVSSDVRIERAARVAGLLENAAGTGVLAADAAKPAPFRCRFDAVLVDVPCSGLGTLRRNPEIKWRLQPEQLVLLAHSQSAILDAASETVAEGGRLLYSTCSTEPEENEQIICSFLDRHPGFRLVRPASPPGIERWTGADQMVRTFPSTRLWDGFFAALMLRQ